MGHSAVYVIKIPLLHHKFGGIIRGKIHLIWNVSNCIINNEAGYTKRRLYYVHRRELMKVSGHRFYKYG